MCEHYRVLAPVGFGGFDIEHIDDTTIVFDCGSRPMSNVEDCIRRYKNHFVSNGDPCTIDYVFLSHFDQDHVNGLEALSKQFTIKNIIVPYIPKRYRVIYNIVTNYSVTAFYNLLTGDERFMGVKLFGSRQLISRTNLYQSVKSTNCKWEWVYKSIFSCSQWERLKAALKDAGIIQGDSTVENNDLFDDSGVDSEQDTWNEKVAEVVGSWSQKNNNDNFKIEDDGISVEKFDIDSYEGEVKLSKAQIQKINEIIGELFGKGKVSYAKNENGLLMLSKKITQNVRSNVFYPCEHPFPHFYRYPHHYSLSACIYTGDMRFDVKSCPTILDFLKMANEPLLLFQIPHHGSSRNSSAKYLQLLPSDLFFWHDKNYNRIYKNRTIVTNIRPLYRLILIDTDTFLFCGFRIQ